VSPEKSTETLFTPDKREADINPKDKIHDVLIPHWRRTLRFLVSHYPTEYFCILMLAPFKRVKSSKSALNFMYRGTCYDNR
jgi:hypothetical protein